MTKHTTQVTYRGIPIGELRYDWEVKAWTPGAGRYFASKREARAYLVEQYFLDITI